MWISLLKIPYQPSKWAMGDGTEDKEEGVREERS
jgi:hypothetical protein